MKWLIPLFLISFCSSGLAFGASEKSPSSRGKPLFKAAKNKLHPSIKKRKISGVNEVEEGDLEEEDAEDQAVEQGKHQNNERSGHGKMSPSVAKEVPLPESLRKKMQSTFSDD